MNTVTSPEALEPILFSPPSIGDAEAGEVMAVLQSGWLTTGPRVERFEREFAAYVGARYALAVNSCTAALHLSLLAAGIGPGDEVVTTPLTFCATANAIVHTGATPVFADVDPVTMNLTPASAAAAVTSRTRAVLPVHFAGRPVDVPGFRALAESRGLVVVDDAAHAVEASSGPHKVGAVSGDLTCFSFYATKNLTTAEGGMVTTNRRDWAERIRVMSLHGMSRDAWARYSVNGSQRYDVQMAGFKYNMSDLQAALGIHQLASIDDRRHRREAIWRRYDAGLAGLPLERPAPTRPYDRHARHLYTILVDEAASGWTRDGLAEALRARGVATAVHFTALHLHSFYAERFGLQRGMFPAAEFISDRTLSLPLSPAMTDGIVDRVIDAVRECMAGR
ncbi:MAG: DegT/DnrJ/EryC1/StrS family aminotransferase [Acidobacteria bacterium]|nr:DegT/DnrJ/EryC1/StrS family aminotransferase [Acidobacteriota bacterium]